MTKRKSTITARCQYFTWIIFKRGDVYYADGRSGSVNLGKHSLNTKTEAEAMEKLQSLDSAKAREHGLIPIEPAGGPSQTVQKEPLSIVAGWQKYLDHCGRPVGLGGVSQGTKKKYRSVRDKHVRFCETSSIQNWNEFNTKRAEQYGEWLLKRNYSPRTFYFEMNLLISVCKWLIAEKLLREMCRIRLPLVKPSGTDTYCYTQKQVHRMLEFCLETEPGRWIRPVLIALATTGMRIGELIALRWEDIDIPAEKIRVVDNRSSRRHQLMGTTRTTKGKRGRFIPLHPALMEALSGMKRHPDGFVFHGSKGARLRDRRVLEIFKREIRNPLKKEFPTSNGEIGFQDGTIHSYRHYFVSECFRQGATEVEIMDWVGHRDSEMVHHYRHLRPDHSQRRMQSLNFLGDDAVSSS